MDMTVLWDIASCSLVKYNGTSEVSTAAIIIALIMETVRTSETLVSFNETIWRFILEDCRLQTRRRENLKSHVHLCVCN
jgi:hypothetical protein